MNKINKLQSANSFFVVCWLFCPTFAFKLNANYYIDKPNLIVISYDGFRNEYLRRNVTPNLLNFRYNGVYVDHMINVFPTKTFTNHHTIATGLYPDAHGVLANSIFDKNKGELKYGYDLFHYNDTVLPIWTVNEIFRNGHSGCMMWPGSDFNFSGVGCTYTQVYDKNISLKNRVDIMMQWLTDSEKPANLVMFYSEQPDKLAHMTGPDSRKITDMVAKIDRLTLYIQEQLATFKLLDFTNIIHLSDHGMASVNPTKFINLTDFLEPTTVKFFGTSPVLQVVPGLNETHNVYQRLLDASKKNGNFNVYRAKDLPERWHASNEKRFGPIIVVAKMNYAFHDMWSLIPDASQASQYGLHGYDNNEPLMNSIFMAKGPSFKSGGHKVDLFDTVDLFPLFLYLLGLMDASGITNDKSLIRNGRFEKVSSILVGFKILDTTEYTTILVIVYFAAIGLLITLFVSIYVVQFHRRRKYFPPTI